MGLALELVKRPVPWWTSPSTPSGTARGNGGGGRLSPWASGASAWADTPSLARSCPSTALVAHGTSVHYVKAHLADILWQARHWPVAALIRGQTARLGGGGGTQRKQLELES